MQFINKQDKFISGLTKFFVVGLFFIGVFFVSAQNVLAESVEQFRYYAMEDGNCVCKDLEAMNFTDARNITNAIVPAIKTCTGDSLVTFTKGKCPQAAVGEKEYYCFLKNNRSTCFPFKVKNDIEAEQRAIAQCETKSFTQGTCPAVSDGDTEIPSGKSAEKLLSDASGSLNPARINQPTDLIGKAIRLLMAFIGSISLVLYVFAGILWLSASGAPDRVDKAKKVIVWTTLGVVVMLASYMLVNFAFKSLGV